MGNILSEQFTGYGPFLQKLEILSQNIEDAKKSIFDLNNNDNVFKKAFSPEERDVVIERLDEMMRVWEQMRTVYQHLL